MKARARRLAVFFCCVGLWGCELDQRPSPLSGFRGVPESPTAPTQAVPPPSAEIVPTRIAGTVIDEDGRPVPGAAVDIDGVRASTDPSGAVAIELPTHRGRPENRRLYFYPRVTSAGYEDAVFFLEMRVGETASPTFRLYRQQIITSGESRRIVIIHDGSRCIWDMDYGYQCRRVRVRAPARGTLVMEVASATATTGQLGLQVIGGLNYFFDQRTTLRVPIDSQHELVFDVLRDWNAQHPEEFSIHTSLEP